MLDTNEAFAFIGDMTRCEIFQLPTGSKTACFDDALLQHFVPAVQITLFAEGVIPFAIWLVSEAQMGDANC